MKKENIGNKIWYRALKVVFFLFCIIVFIVINFIIWEISGDEHISDNTFKRVGSIVKQVYPVYNYNNMSDIEVGKQVYSKRYDIWEKYYRLPKILIDYTYRSVWQRILYNVLTSIILLFTFWLIAKVFFYIALGEKFLSFSFLRNNK